MQTGYYSSAGAMVTQFNKLDNITNNLANINTNGFKKQKKIIGDFLRLFKETRDKLPLENHTKDSAKFYHRTMARVPHIVESFTNFEIGALEKTGNDLDFALKDKELFFVVKTPNGIRLTKNGSFTLNDKNILINKKGHQVLGKDYFDNNNPIILSTRHKIEVDKNANIYQNKKNVDNLMLVKVNNIKELKKEGNNLYIIKSPDDLQIQENSNALHQGYIEKSNVNAITEMASLIDTNRLVGMYQKVMDSQMNDLNRDSIEKLAYLRG